MNAPTAVGLIAMGTVAVTGRIDVATGALVAAALGAYATGAWSLRAASEVCEVSRVARWAYPCGGLQRIGFRALALGQVLRRQPASWRGRAVVN